MSSNLQRETRQAPTTDSSTGGDADDFYAQLLVLRHKYQAGNAQAALVGLVALRDVVAHSMDPKARGILTIIDREINAVHAACRIDKKPRRPLTALSLLSWLHRASERFDRALVRLAISVILAIHLYELLSQLGSI